jgi:hypothetical protein
LGDWLAITREEYVGVMERAGGLRALTVAATLTDPDGVYGEPQVYTAWALPNEDVPLVDRRTYPDRPKGSDIYRRFIRCES